MRILFALVAIALAAPAVAAEAEMTGDAAIGLAYARENCSECHAVTAGEAMSPRTDAPTFTTIANTRGMTDLALVSFFQTDHPTMPNFVVPASAVRDLITYLQTLKD